MFAHPAVSGRDPAALGQNRDFMGAVWQRIESYIAWRFAQRGAVWLVDGPGD